jgi:hypothetical protein
LSRTLDLPSNTNKPIEPILTSLHSEPSLLILDNLETIGHRQYSSSFKSEFLDRLTFEKLVLIVTTRADREFPVLENKADWIRVSLKRVEQDVAYQILESNSSSNDIQISDELNAVLKGLDGHPLSIRLFAANISPHTSLAVVCQRWQSTRVRMLKQGDGNERDLDLRTSLEVSLNSPRLAGNDGSELVYLLAILPDGMLVEDVDSFFKDFGEARRAVLESGLAYEEASCLRQLVPIKEAIVGMVKDQKDTLTRCYSFYIVKGGELSAQSDFNIAVPSWFISQIVNFEFIVRHFLAKGDLNTTVVLQSLLNFVKSLTGLGDHLLTIEIYKTVRESLLVRSPLQRCIPLALFLSHSKIDVNHLILFMWRSAELLVAYDVSFRDDNERVRVM